MATLLGMGVGGGVGAWSSRLLRTDAARGAGLGATGLASGAATLMLGIAPSLLAIVATAALAGSSQAAYMAVSVAVVRTAVPERARLRITSAFVTLAAVHIAIGNLAMGWWADPSGSARC